MTTCPVRTTCSLCWPGSLSWRKPTFTWQGKKSSSSVIRSHLPVAALVSILCVLCSLQSSLGLGHLPRLFSAAMSCLLSPHAQVVSAAANTLKVMTLSSVWVIKIVSSVSACTHLVFTSIRSEDDQSASGKCRLCVKALLPTKESSRYLWTHWFDLN